MKDRPILFSAPMVRAILDGRKSQTRRVVKPQPSCVNDLFIWKDNATIRDDLLNQCPYGRRSDRLWVRETWQGPMFNEDQLEAYQSNRSAFETPEYCRYAADGGNPPEFFDADDNLRCRWRPSIHMFRWASRITLEITDVRVERLLDISEADALAEGVIKGPDHYTPPIPEKVQAFYESSARRGYSKLWKQINGPDSWDANPWVWVVAFKRIKP